MRHEEREKLRVETQTYRMDLEHTYQKRNEALKQRELAVDELLKQKKELEEREIFTQRQHLLDEIKQLRAKEEAFKESTSVQSRMNMTDSTKYDKLCEELKAREAKLKQQEEEFETKLRSERERLKIDLDRAYGHREFLLQSVENKNKQDAQHNQIERTHLERIKHDHNTQQMRISELELNVQKLCGEAMCLKQENELIKDKLNRCMDYDFLKQENKMLKYKLDISKEIIGEKSFSKRTTPKPSSNYEQVNLKLAQV